MVSQTYCVQVPYQETHTQTYTVNVPYTEMVEQPYTVTVPYTEQVEQTYNVQVPYTEADRANLQCLRSGDSHSHGESHGHQVCPGDHDEDRDQGLRQVRMCGRGMPFG